MELFLIFALGVFAGVVAAKWFQKGIGRRGARLPVRRQWEDSDANKAKLLQAFVSRGRMAKDSVMEILGVSEAAAMRYLDELERDGRIRRLGTTGRGVYYEKA